MKKWVRYAIGIIILLVVLIGVTSGTHNSARADTVAISDITASVSAEAAPAPAPAPAVDSVVEDPGPLEQFGPPGMLISGALGGLLMVIRAFNEGKKIDVTTYKERAAEAESRSNSEIVKVQNKLAELETKLDAVIEDRDQYRTTLEERKAQYTAQVIELERRHQRELEDMHAALLVEIHVRHGLERLMAENGISIPKGAPRYTQQMDDDAQAEMDITTQGYKDIRDNE